MPDENTELTQNANNELMRRQQHPQQASHQGQQEVKLEQQLPIQPTIQVEQTLGVPPPQGPPPPYQDIYPVQPQYWNDQPWPPAPPHPDRPSPTLWPGHVHSDRHHIPMSPRPSVHMIGGQIIRPTRVPATVRWFFGTITFMMIFSIVCAFVYVLIVAINFK